MKSFVAMQRAIHGDTTRHAQELKVSTSAVTKWQEPYGAPTDSGSRNPLDVIRMIVTKSFRDGNESDDALAPIHYLAQQFNLVCIPIDHIPADYSDVLKCIMATNKHLAGLLSENCTASAEGSIDSCKGDIHKKGWLAIQQIMTLLATIDDMDKKGDLLAKAKGL